MLKWNRSPPRMMRKTSEPTTAKRRLSSFVQLQSFSVDVRLYEVAFLNKFFNTVCEASYSGFSYLGTPKISLKMGEA